MKAKIIVLDRDGVINRDSVQFIKSPDEWEPIDGSVGAIVKLNQAGYKVVVATNQSGIARGLFTPEVLTAIHQKMLRIIEQAGGHLDGIYVCPHGPESDCECRKPKPGLLRSIAADFKVDTTDMIVIGDSMRDLQAARACGAQAILVKTGKGAQTLLDHDIGNIPVYENLAEAVLAILSK